MSTNLFSKVPANIAELRRRLFSLKKPLELPREEWERVWPYVATGVYKGAIAGQESRGIRYTKGLTSARGEKYPAPQGTIKTAERQPEKAAEGP